MFIIRKYEHIPPLGFDPKSLIDAISQSSVSLALVAPPTEAENTSPGAQAMALYIREGFALSDRARIEVHLP